ncbi:hypothetical protein H6P81_007347 [Aristolochia fimbriata]|uniref:Uncharacterized protein n=1 Tax=Aristolochia fimbriata TaxID=158543 RepID=A0AAV7F4F6_ARIFI|nr:hypothetical protein H6P81_007347 [Aristolochia fimbriata]
MDRTEFGRLFSLDRVRFRDPSPPTTPAENPNPIRRNSGNFRRLSDTELQSKLERGLCFRCDERYSPGHRCRSEQLQFLLVNEDDVDGEDLQTTDCEAIATEDSPVELSLHSVAELTAAHTIKFRGRLQEKEAIILVDSGGQP